MTRQTFRTWLTLVLPLVAALTMGLGAQQSGGASNPDLTKATGNLSVSHLNSGTGASSSTFWRGDGTWAAPAGGTFPASLNGGTVFGGLGTNGYAQLTNSGNTAFNRFYFGPQSANGVLELFNPNTVSFLDGALADAVDLNFRQAYITSGILLNTNGFLGKQTFSGTLPTITSGFGSGPAPAITGISGAAAFRLTIGGGGVATTGVLGLSPSAQIGWACDVTDITTSNLTTRVSAMSQTSITISTTVAWTAADVLVGKCAAF